MNKRNLVISYLFGLVLLSGVFCIDANAFLVERANPDVNDVSIVIPHVSTPISTGYYAKIAFDSVGKMHAVYTSSGLMYANESEDGILRQAGYSGAGLLKSNTTDPDLAMNNSIPHAVYSSNEGAIYVYYQDFLMWRTHTIDANTHITNTRIDLDSNNLAQVVYISDYHNLKFTRRTNTDDYTQWSTSVEITDVSIESIVSADIAVNSSDYCYVLFEGDNKIYYTIINPITLSYSVPVQLSSTGKDSFCPKLFYYNDNHVYAAWIQQESLFEGVQIYQVYFIDLGLDPNPDIPNIISSNIFSSNSWTWVDIAANSSNCIFAIGGVEFDALENYQSHPIYGRESVDLAVLSNATGGQFTGARISMNNWGETPGNIAVNPITGEPVLCCVPGINLFTRDNYEWYDTYNISINFDLDELWCYAETPMSFHVSVTSSVTETVSYIIRSNKNTGTSQSIGTLTAGVEKTFDFSYTSFTYSVGDFEDFPNNPSNDWIEIQIFNDTSATSAAKALFEYRVEIFIAEQPPDIPGYFLPIIILSLGFGVFHIHLKRKCKNPNL